MSWPMVNIGEVCRVLPGFAFKSGYFAEHGIPVVKIASIRDDLTVDTSSAQCLPESVLTEQMKRFFLKDGDIVLAMTGATVGKIGRVRTNEPLLLNQRVAKIEPIQANSDYIWCVLSAKRYRDRFYNLAGGAAQPNLSGSQIEGTKIPLPPKTTQEHIAEILMTYNDLIANHARRIELLERSAHLLFKEWFIQLRYPGHEHDKIVDEVPEGWERKTLGSLTTKIGSGATPRGGEASYKEAGITLIRSQNVYDYRFEEAGLAFIDDGQAEQLANVEVQAGDVLLNITGASVGRCCMVPTWCLPARVNQHVMIIRARKQQVSPYFLLCALNSDSRKRHLLSVSSGGVSREALTIDLVSRLEFVLPRKAVLDEFGKVVESIFCQCDALQRQNRLLTKARDLLLPRLMDGRIAI